MFGLSGVVRRVGLWCGICAKVDSLVFRRLAGSWLLVFVLMFCAGVGSARGEVYSWRTEGGVRELLDEGVVLERWAPKQWTAWEQEVRGIAECLGRASGCASAIMKGETAVSSPTLAMADDAENVVNAAREEGPALGTEFTERLIHLGQSAGTLPGNSEVQVPLWQSEYLLALEIGNGLEESFLVPEWKLEPADGNCEQPRFDFPSPSLEASEYYVLNCRGVKMWESEPNHISSKRLAECYSYSTKELCNREFERYFNEEKEHFWKYETTQNRLETPMGCSHYQYGETEGSAVVWILREVICTPRHAGIPRPGPLSKEQERIDHEHTGAYRLEMPGVSLPSEPPSRIGEEQVQNLSEDRLLLEFVRSHSPREANAQGEAEEGYGLANAGAPDRRGCFAGGPVDCATGNQVVTQTDLTVGKRGPSFGLTRTYNSQLAAAQSQPGPFGYGWNASYGAKLTFNEEVGTVTVHQDDGSAVVFETGTSGQYVPINGFVEATLAKEGSNYLYILPDQTTLHFNSTGQLTSEVDRNGNTLTMAYESKGHLESITDGAGRKVTLAYNAEGQVESVKDPIGHVVKYTYESGDLATVTLPDETKPSWQYKYNSAHELTSETDGREQTTTTEYNEAHQVTTQTDPMSRKRTWRYTPTEAGSETTITEPNGSTTVEQFNIYGSPTSVTRASGTSIAATTAYEYNGADELIAVIDPNSHKTEYSYDSAGDRTSEKNTDDDETKWEYDSTHDVTAVTFPGGEKTTIERDSHGNALKVYRPAPGETTQTTKYKYDIRGDIESMTSSLGRRMEIRIRRLRRPEHRNRPRRQQANLDLQRRLTGDLNGKPSRQRGGRGRSQIHDQNRT